MGTTTVSKQQMLNLLDKLSRDDAFRTRFEKDPKSALLEAGIPAEKVASLPAEQLQPWTLPDKSTFAAERQRVADDIAEEFLCMVHPSPQLGIGKK